MAFDFEKLRSMILVERSRLQLRGRDLDAADVIALVMQWLRETPEVRMSDERIDALKYINKLINNKFRLYHQPPVMSLDPGARAMLTEIQCHVQAAIIRLERGEPMDPLLLLEG